jgi:lysophospholipase L1-like esterase
MQAEIGRCAGPGPATRHRRVCIGGLLIVTALLCWPLHQATAKSAHGKSANSVSLALPPLDPALAGPPLDPTWRKHLFVVLDSVLLGAKPNLIRSMPDWEVTVAGRPALMISKAVGELRERQGSYGPVAVVALGYNSLWEKDRKNFRRWADRFDKSVEDMLALLKQRGARKIVWVMLREPTPDLVPGGGVGLSQYHKYAWYFPYVNERLRAIKQRHPEMALADWASAGRRPGVTYDLIHLNSPGADLMVALVKAAIGIEARPLASAAPATVTMTAAPPRAGQEQPPRQEAQAAPEATAPAPARPPAESAPAANAPPAANAAPAAVPAKKPSYRTRRLGMFALARIPFATIVMLGDSLTARAQWSDITGCPYVANRGVGGDESENVLHRLDAVIKLKPSAVLLMVGINDILSNVPTQTTVDNVQQTIDALTQAGAHVYLTLALPGTKRVSHKIGSKLDELNAAYRKLATRPDVSLVDFLPAARDRDGFLREELSTDGIHLTPKGYRVWRDAIMPIVRRHCRPKAALNEQAAPAEQAPVEVTGTIAPAPAMIPPPAAASAPPAATIIPATRATEINHEAGGAERREWVIQVGAFPGQEQAEERIRKARNLGRTILAHADPFTEKFVKDGEERYRARFAGFSRDSAEAACDYFKSNHIDCFVAKTARPVK